LLSSGTESPAGRRNQRSGWRPRHQRGSATPRSVWPMMAIAWRSLQRRRSS